MLIFGMIAAMIIGYRALNKEERKLLTKIIRDCIVYAILTMIVVGVIVYFF